jgi:hypothetical protein
MKSNQAILTNLPLKRSLRPVYASSLIIAFLMAGVALAGLTFSTIVYPSDPLTLAFLPVDVVHLLVGLPILLTSMALARRDNLVGLLCWPGILLYIIYSFITNLIGVGFGVLFLPYLLLVIFSVYTLIALTVSIDAEVVRQRLAGKVPERLAGGVLVLLTCLFILINLVNIYGTLTNLPSTGTQVQSAVMVADFAIIPAMIIGGLQLWRRAPLGYVGGAGLLLAYSLLFVGLIPAMLFPVFYRSSPVPVADISIIIIWSLFCIIPFGLFLRGIMVANRSLSNEN